MSRELMRAARAWADQQTDRVAEIPSTRAVIVTVAAISPALTVTWRTGTYTAAGSLAAYTPAVNDRVLCLLVDNQLIVVDRIV